MTSTSVSSIKNVNQGSIVTFRSKNPSDLVSWVGTLESIGTYKSILPYMNPAAYNQAVRQVDPTVSADPTTLTYFLITVSNNAQEPTIQVFAQEWIAAGTLYVITPGNTVSITVEDPLNNSQAILSLLASGGYAATLNT